eukprot:scaffold142791_cov40-Cyclotella_meneghiniana.AAC.1
MDVDKWSAEGMSVKRHRGDNTDIGGFDDTDIRGFDDIGGFYAVITMRWKSCNLLWMLTNGQLKG